MEKRTHTPLPPPRAPAHRSHLGLLRVDRPGRIEDLPPDLRTLVGEADLAGLADDGRLDRGLVLHLVQTALFEWPEPDSPAWLAAAIAARPGIWITRLCRVRHGLPETGAAIAWCGTCRDVASPRKRIRAARLPARVLPGFEAIGGAYQLHPPCSRRGLTWLRHQLYRLVGRGRIVKRREKRPDRRQPRGWDWMSCLYPSERQKGP